MTSSSDNTSGDMDKFLNNLSSIPQEQKNQFLGRMLASLLPTQSYTTEVITKEKTDCGCRPKAEVCDFAKYITDRLCDGIIPDKERLALSEIRKMVKDVPSDVKMVPLGCKQFQDFLNEVSVGKIVECDLINISNGNYFLVPPSVIEFINKTHANLRREQEEQQARTISQLQEQQARTISQLQEQIDQMKSTYMAPPDYSKRLVVKAYSAPAMSEFTAPENGYIMCTARVQNECLFAKIDGEDVSNATGSGDGLVWGACNRYFFTFYLRKGQKFCLTSGDYHAAWFYPCLKL